MDRKRRYLYVLLVLSTLLSCYAATAPKNACGGTTNLTNQPMSWCDPGEHASSSQDCRMGVFHCTGPNTVICMPIDCPESNRYKSSFVASVQSKQTSCPVDCGERGHCDRLDGVCVCDKGWSGENCGQFTDPCSSPFAQCGDRGSCVDGGQGTYRCECAQGWTGALCNIPTQCLPNGLWAASSKKCLCFDGWEGAACTTCNPDYLCLPTKNRNQPFSLTFVPKEVQEKFLKAKLGDAYVADNPIRPNSTYDGVLYDCACKAIQQNSESLQENLIYYDDLTGAFYVQHYPHNHPYYHSSFTHDYYWQYYSDDKTTGIVIAVIVVSFFAYYIYLYAAKYYSEKRAERIAEKLRRANLSRSLTDNQEKFVPVTYGQAPKQISPPTLPIPATTQYQPNLMLDVRDDDDVNNDSDSEDLQFNLIPSTEWGQF